MFTGIISERGRVAAIETVEDEGGKRFTIACSMPMNTLKIGASVCCSGACLTVVAAKRGWFMADVSRETLSLTTCNEWEIGSEINLEASLTLGDALGGHIVTGHVDGVAKVEAIQEDGNSYVITYAAPKRLKKFIAAKGSVTLNGVSLTVNRVKGRRFQVAIIPHTWDITNFHGLQVGDFVNLEVDVLARYVVRLRK